MRDIQSYLLQSILTRNYAYIHTLRSVRQEAKGAVHHMIMLNLKKSLTAFYTPFTGAHNDAHNQSALSAILHASSRYA